MSRGERDCAQESSLEAVRIKAVKIKPKVQWRPQETESRNVDCLRKAKGIDWNQPKQEAMMG